MKPMMLALTTVFTLTAIASTRRRSEPSDPARFPAQREE